MSLIPTVVMKDLKSVEHWLRVLAQKLGPKSDPTFHNVDVTDMTASGTIHAAAIDAPHNTLSGKQGGTTDEYYHLTAAQHAGLSGSVSTFIALAGENVSALKVVYMQSGTVFVASSSTVAQVGRIAGVAITAATTGNSLTIQTAGRLVDLSWSWTVNLPIYLGSAGLTQTPPTTGFSCQVATPVSATEILIDIKTSILLG